MKLQRTTLILLLLALGLGGFVYFYEVRGAAQRESAKAKEGKIFFFDKEQIQSFAIATQQQTLKFERVNQTGNKSQLSQWQMKAPTDTPASDSSVSFLLNLLVDGRSDRTFPISPNRLQEYGLDKPQATVEIKLKNQQNHQLILGKPDYNRNFIYAQADANKNNQQLQVLLLPITLEYAVKRPLSEWKQTPDKVTPSPSPTKSEKLTSQNSDKVTPSPSLTQSQKPTPSNLDKATPSPALTKSEKPTSQNSDRVTPSPSPTKSEKPTSQNSDRATPSPLSTNSEKYLPEKSLDIGRDIFANN